MSDTGGMKLYDNELPALKAGDSYTIAATLVVQDDSGTTQENTDRPAARGAIDPTQATYTVTQSFTVSDFLFSLDPSLIQAYYPPSNSQGNYAQTFPHIVLANPTLPWHQAIDPAADNPNVPWVALLVLDDDNQSHAPSRNMTIGEAFTDSPQVTLPYKPDSIDPALLATSCQVLEIDAGLFATITPTLDELAYLAHVREVDMLYKASQGVDTGTFAVVVGNRLPKPGVLNTVHLVSLQGFSADLRPAAPANAGRLRLFSLASWSFICQAEQDNDDSQFKLLMERLAQSCAALSVPAASPNPTVANALANGYIALQHMTRPGEQTVSWYRGPLTPGPVTRLFSQVPYANADQAVIYDKATGLFDQSYAVAWQIGRFLALADAAFSTALTNWRHQGQQLLAMLDQRQALFHSYYPTVDLPDDVKTLVNTRLPRQIARNILRRIVAPRAVPSDSINRPLIPIIDPSRLRDRTEQLAGLFSPQEIDDIFMSGAEPTTELRRRLVAQPKRSRGGKK